MRTSEKWISAPRFAMQISASKGTRNSKLGNHVIESAIKDLQEA